MLQYKIFIIYDEQSRIFFRVGLHALYYTVYRMYQSNYEQLFNFHPFLNSSPNFTAAGAFSSGALLILHLSGLVEIQVQVKRTITSDFL
jgi:hypothetical protein